jgi:TonB family protein
MISRHSLFLLLILTLLVSKSVANEKEVASLIERAKQLSDLRAEGAPAFRVKLNFKIFKEDGSALEGAYTEVWVSKAQWHRETTLGDFRRTQVAAGRKSWLLDSTAIVPEHIGDISAILPEFGEFRPEAWKSLKDGKVNGVSVRCLENNSPSAARRALCFDKVSGTLTAQLWPSLVGARIGERSCFYSDYQRFADRVLARSYECDEDIHPRLEVRIVELVAEPAPDPALFAPPDGAKESVNCLGPAEPPTAVHHQEPRSPRSLSVSTLVVMRVVIGTDGKPHNLNVTSAPNHDFDEAALDAVRQWRFKPATCDGEPMEKEISVEIDFHHY